MTNSTPHPTIAGEPHRTGHSSARVAASEAELLSLTRALFDGTATRFIPLLRRKRRRIETLGPTAMALLRQTLAHGVSLALLRQGGWQRRRTLYCVEGEGQAEVRSGRIWQRHRPLPPLHFTAASFDLLTWLHSEDVAQPKAKLGQAKGGAPLSPGDELLHYLALAPLEGANAKLSQPAFRRSPLCQLANPGALVSGKPALPKIDFGPLVTGPGAVILEALQSDLAKRWVALEASKNSIVGPRDMCRLGDAQTRALDGLFAAIEASAHAGCPARRDLASFLAEAGAALLAHGPDARCPLPQWWTESLTTQAPLSERQTAFRGAAAFLRALAHTLGGWVEDAGLVAHFDDDYAAAQLLLSNWRLFHGPLADAPSGPHRDRPDTPSLPPSVLGRARHLVAALESLHSLGKTPG